MIFVLLTHFPSNDGLGREVRCVTENIKTIIEESKLYSDDTNGIRHEISIWENEIKYYAISYENLGSDFLFKRIVDKLSNATDEIKNSSEIIENNLKRVLFHLTRNN